MTSSFASTSFAAFSDASTAACSSSFVTDFSSTSFN
tara:strand:+ start:77 stop:184 length:108 start_codon:yes stop_codon:yes gene_type:complete